MVVGNQIVRDAIKPGRKWQTHVLVTANAFQRFKKDFGG
jgi:hypothetical protein